LAQSNVICHLDLCSVRSRNIDSHDWEPHTFIAN
jgi:hypothetical protein